MHLIKENVDIVLDQRLPRHRYAVEKINDETNLLNSSRLSAQIEKIPPRDSFHASKRGDWASCFFSLADWLRFPHNCASRLSTKFISVCNLLHYGVAALFGPESGTTSRLVDNLEQQMIIDDWGSRKNIVDPWEEEISAVECLHKPAIKLNLLLPL